MLTLLLKSIGLVSADTEIKLYPRQLDLGGNIVMFSMPENFSKDFPAEDMIESVDTNQDAVFSKTGGILVLQRYWDFRTRSFFSKNAGTLKMNVVVKKADVTSGQNIASQSDFIKIISADLRATYESSNSKNMADDKTHYSNLADDFVEFSYNQQKWLRYSIWKDNDRDLTSVFAIPVTSNRYLTVSFSFAPSTSLSMREFIDDYAQSHINMIMETFVVKYNMGNSLE